MKTFRVKAENGEECLVVIQSIGTPGELEGILTDDLLELNMTEISVVEAGSKASKGSKEGLILQALVELARQELLGSWNDGVDLKEELEENLTDAKITLKEALEFSDVILGHPKGTFKGSPINKRFGR